MAKKNYIPVEKTSTLKEGLQKRTQEDIDKGLSVDYNKLAETGTVGSPESFEGIESYYPSLPGDYYDKYEDYIDNNTLKGERKSLETLNSLRAENQSNWEQAGNAVGRVATNILPQIASGFASMLDLEGYINAEHAANNSIVKWADEIQKNTAEYFPIYTEGEAMDLGDFAWWMDRGSGLVTSVGAFLAQGAGMGKLISSGLKGLGQISKGKDLMRAVVGAEKSKQFLQGSSALANAVALNQSEAVLEATHVYQNIYDEKLSQGYSIKDAQKSAAIGASTTMNLNKINILLNLTSASAFIKPFKYSRNLVKDPNIWSSVSKTLLEGGQEATEELINHVASKAGESKGKGKTYTWENALEDMGSAEGFESAFLGALGGIAQTGGTKLLQGSKYGVGSIKDEEGNRKSYKQQQRERYTKQQEVINELKDKGVKVTDVMYNVKEKELFKQKLKKAVEENDQATYDNLQKEMFEMDALKHFQAGTTEILEEAYKNEANRNPEEVGQEYVDNAKQALTSLKELEKVYNNFEEYENVQDIYLNRANKVRVDNDVRQLDSLEKDSRINRDKQIKEIADKYSFEAETGSYPLVYHNSDIEQNQGDTPHNKKVYDKFLAEVQALDSYKEHTIVADQLEQGKKYSEVLQNDFKNLTSEEAQIKAKEERAVQQEMSIAKTNLDKETSIEAIKAQKEKFKNPLFDKMADNRISEIEREKIIAHNDKKVDQVKKDIRQELTITPLEGLDSVREKINNLEISQKHKDELLENVNDRASVLNGVPTSEETTDVADILGGTYDQGGETDDREDIKHETETLETIIPEDLPDPKKEEELVNEVNEETSKEILQDSNIPETKYTKASNRAAYRSAEMSEESDDDARNEIVEKYKNILNPNNLLSGSKVTFRVKPDYIGFKYDRKNQTTNTITWAEREEQLIKKYGDDYRRSEEYINEVPIVAIDKDGNETFFLHDTSWIREENNNGSTEEIQQDRENLTNLRKQIIANGEVTTTITYKGLGHLLKTYEGVPISINNAMPDKNLKFAVFKNGKLSTEGKIINKELKSGRVYVMLPVGPTSEKQHLAVAIQRTQVVTEVEKQQSEELNKKLSKAKSQEVRDNIQQQLDNLQGEKITNTVVRAIELYLEGDSKNQTVQEIYNSTGLNITEISDLRNFIKKFVPLVSVGKEANAFENILTLKTDKTNSGQALMTITGNSIEFGRPKVNAMEGRKSISLSKNFKEKPGDLEVKLAKLRNTVRAMMVNSDIDSLSRKGKFSQITFINKDDSTSTIPYTEFIRSTHQTNVLGINIGTEENPNYVYTIQPTITFDDSFVAVEPKTVTQEETVEKEVSESAEKVEIKIDQDTYTFNGEDEESDAEIDEFLEEDEDYIAPTVSENILNDFKSKADSYRIIGLDPRDQESLISYLAARISTEALNKKGIVNSKEIFDKELNKLKELAEQLDNKGLINKAKRIKAITKQWNKVSFLTNQFISLYNSGTVSNAVDNTDVLSEEVQENGLERTHYNDDWTFTISSKNTASSDLKKFFSFIQNVDNEGNNVVNSVLGIPEVIGFDTVYNTLHEILANKPNDYNTMVQYLELYENKFPWLKNVVKQLEKAPEKIKNEFVTDMTKHHIQMNFVMWSKDFNGKYTLQNWSSNSSSIEEQLRRDWKSNLRGKGKSNLINVNEDGQYIFNPEVVQSIKNQAEEWLKTPPNAIEGPEMLAKWLGNFGIILSENTYKDLIAGKFNNKGKISWAGLFKNDNGIVQVLSKQLDKAKDSLVDEVEILNDSVVKALSNLEAKNSINTFSNSFNAGTKTVYSYSNNNYLVNRMRDLTQQDSEGNLANTDLIDRLSNIPFISQSSWLAGLKSEGEEGKIMREIFSVGYVSLEALKRSHTPSKDNRKLNQLTTVEHEAVKIGMFQNSGKNIIDGENRRTVSFFYPTMSDKSTMTTIKTLARELTLTDEGNLSEENLDILYTTTVLPEIKRIASSPNQTKINGYEPSMFFFYPALNELNIIAGEQEVNLRQYVLDGNGFTPEVKSAIKQFLSDTFNILATKKITDWTTLGIGGKDNSLLDKSYMKEIAKGKVDYAAKDYVFNYLIANAEISMLFSGDPALYFKKDINGTYVNLKKRLAGDIAPGMELANSSSNRYYQVFFNDTQIDSNNIKDPVQLEYFSKIMKDFGDSYSNIDGSDAQEYTTWQEHLYVLNQLGRITEEQHKLIKSKLEGKQRLSYKELQLVMQPLKPVYVGNGVVTDEHVDRRVYIKSSSFPLLPQLTKGLEIDKIREALEKFQNKLSNEGSFNQDGKPFTIRASFNTANKVGGLSKADSITVFDKDGNVNDIEITENNALLLDRSNFRIQQDVPYKREKEEINIGTQAETLLFVNLLDVEIEEGILGEQLKQKFDQHYENLFKYKQEQLMEALDMYDEKTDEEGNVTKTQKKGSVNASKLQAILVKEVTTRQGYPMNMLDALELDEVLNEDGSINEEKTNFKVPLWASPYASKFESLLTSLVSNKIVKQKFPGHSYVLGSQEGFKVREGNSIPSDISIIFSENFDPEKGLQPMRYDEETKSMLPAQVILPFKFRDNQGNILSLKEFIKEVDGKQLIDFDKIPQKVLKLFGFRIPTQEQNSMSSIEIVGFLPEEQGDLLLAPRDFTKQMGSDFDIDKLYSYMYNTYFEEGKLHTDFESDLKKIKEEQKTLTEELDVLKTELKVSKDEEELINLYINREDDEQLEFFNTLMKDLTRRSSKEVKEDLDRITTRLYVLKKSYVAFNQNAILDIHHRIMQSTNPQVVKSIIALDSPGKFKDYAKEISEIRAKEGIITFLSETYQRDSYTQGIAGKAGVAKFSVDSTFNASTQGKGLQVRSMKDLPITFGNITSKGNLSDKYTLASRQKIIDHKGAYTNEFFASLKTKSSIIRNLQSAAVDNANEPILGHLNINDVTFPVITAMTTLGFEEEDIVGLITSPIIWEYVDRIQKSKSSFNTYNPQIKDIIKTSLVSNYDPAGLYDEEGNSEKFYSVSGTDLLKDTKEGITIGKGSNDVNCRQVGALYKFLDLMTVGETIGEVQRTINVRTKGIPGSLIETQLKQLEIDDLELSTIQNADKLLENTTRGFAVEYGLKTVNQIYNKYFPYKEDGISSIVREVSTYTKDDLSSTSAKIDLIQEVFNGMKSFYFSSPQTFLFTDNPQIERKRLFIDTEDNKSLATILSELSSQSWFQRNGFLNKLSFNLNKNGGVSKVQFEAAAGENFDERNIYLGFNYLITKSEPIGTFNGVEYNTRMLAQDLIASAYLEGGIQGAKQYLKYVPQSFLTSIPFGQYLYTRSFSGLDFGVTNNLLNPSTFTRQYFQNNPKRANIITLSFIEGNPKTYPDIFRLTKDAVKENLVEYTIGEQTVKTMVKFLAIFDKNLPGKHALYEFDEKERNYKRISTLAGDFDFTQYDSVNPNINSIVQKNKPKSKETKVQDIEPTHIISSEPTIVTAQKIGRQDLRGQEYINELLNQLSIDRDVNDYNKELINIMRELGPIKDIKVNLDSNSQTMGKYNPSTNTLTFNFDLMRKLGQSKNKMASNILHEMIHAYTSKLIKLYNKKEFDKLTSQQKSIIEKLERLRRDYFNNLVKQGKLDQYNEVLKKYNKFIEAKRAGENLPPVDLMTEEELSEFYGAMKLEEFVTMALTDPGFQKLLNDVKVNGKSFWRGLIELLSNLISSAFGIQVDPNSLLPQAINESINLMKTYNQVIETKETPLPDDIQSLGGMFDEDNYPLAVSKIEEFKLICRK
jgi:hypothetical protein